MNLHDDQKAAAGGTALFSDTASLTGLRKDLLRFATLQLRDRDTAEDVVQETLTAALAASERFSQRASFKTWAFSILRNKIIDVMRDGWNKRRLDLPVSEENDSDFDGLFNVHSHWQAAERPSDWGDPDMTFENQQFWQVFEACMNNLPEASARVFSMREFLGLETDEICKELHISTSNCWVILHRARMTLRICLEKNWFHRG